MRNVPFIYVIRSLFALGAGIFLFALGVAAKCRERPDPDPIIYYVLRVNPEDLSGYEIEIHLRHVPHHFQLAMATHHEYDDRFWRLLRNFRVETTGGEGSFKRTDSAVWNVSVPGSDAVISYRIELPELHRFAHRPFLAAYGGLVGDIHSFLYLVGQTRIPSTVTFELPQGWQIATGLERTIGGNDFSASSAKALMDCPVLAGYLRQWSFTVEGIPYSVAYLPVPGAPAPDTSLLLANLQKIVVQAVSLFGGAPYRHYAFLLEDGVGGALEHANSVTIGAPAALLSDPAGDIYEEIAHEFLHTWNLMSIEPAGYTDLNYGPQQRSAGLWFSEGLTMFYADLLVRRAGLPCEDPTRVAHLERLIGRYYADTGNTVFTPAEVSLASNAAPGLLGDYTASTHLQGELLGAMLDLLIRNATGDRHSFDDVMRIMYRRFGEKKAFYAQDVEQAVLDVCDTDEVRIFFRRYVYEGKKLDFTPYIRLLGLQLKLSYRPATDKKGQPAPDTRSYIWQDPGDTVYHIGITTPAGCWARAGLHTGDIIRSIDGRPLKDRQDFYAILNTLKIGDTMIIQIDRPAGVQRIPVLITGYEIPVARLIKYDKPI